MYQSVLVGTDGSETAITALEHAIELANRLEIPLYAVAVVETRTAYDSDIVDHEDATRWQRERAETALAAAEATASDAGTTVETALLTGVPHEALLEHAAAVDASLLVVGSRGSSSFRRALLGSTADALVRLAPIPVLVVGNPDDDRPES